MKAQPMFYLEIDNETSLPRLNRSITSRTPSTASFQTYFFSKNHILLEKCLLCRIAC